MTIEFNASARAEQGSGASRRLRRAGHVPAIVYGGGKAATPITLDHNAIFHALRKEAFHSSVINLNLDGAKESVILRDVHMHAYKPLVTHVDFQRVDATHKIHVKVPLHFVNAELSPGVKTQGGIASHVLTELDVQCLPGNLPEFIEVDLSGLSVGHSLHVSGLKLPAGVEAVLHKGEDPVVAAIAVPRGAVEAAAAETPAETK